MAFDISNLILKISISLLLLVVNSIIIHIISEKMNFKDKSYDNPTTIALILSVLFFISTFINFQFIFFLIILVVMVYSVKYFYNVSLNESIKLTLYWFLSVFLIGIILSLLYVLVY